MQAPGPTTERPTCGLLPFLEKYLPVLDPYVGDWEDFGADFVDEAMLPVDRFHPRWQGTPPPLIHRYTTASTLRVYHSNPTV